MVFGQGDTVRRVSGEISFRERAIDSSLLIVDYEKVNSHPASAFFINEKFYKFSIIASLDPTCLSSFKVIEADTIINGELYKGKIYITLNDEFEIKEISLSGIRDKYTDLKEQPTVFIIDGKIVTGDCDTYLMDENVLYTISTGKIKNPDIVFVDIKTKTEENIKERNRFFIRGTMTKKTGEKSASEFRAALDIAGCP
jgi:hypothetical protein